MDYVKMVLQVSNCIKGVVTEGTVVVLFIDTKTDIAMS